MQSLIRSIGGGISTNRETKVYHFVVKLEMQKRRANFLCVFLVFLHSSVQLSHFNGCLIIFVISQFDFTLGFIGFVLNLLW